MAANNRLPAPNADGSYTLHMLAGPYRGQDVDITDKAAAESALDTGYARVPEAATEAPEVQRAGGSKRPSKRKASRATAPEPETPEGA